MSGTRRPDDDATSRRKSESTTDSAAPRADRPGADAVPPPAGGTPAAEDLTGERVLAKCRWVERDGRRRPSLGGLELLARLGKGGMGVVYYGVNPRLDTEVAVKILPRADSEEHDELVNRFVREAKLAARLRSDHLVGVLDVNRDEDSGNHFLVMEYVRGQSAGAWLRGVVKSGEKGVPEAAALDVVIAATKGLAAAHLAGIVHRDIKPDNVLVPADAAGRLLFARAKLADLGLARPEVGEQSLTGHAVALGTPGYMAPEQAEDAKRAKKPADVFAMGATLYALLAGKAPFAGATAMDAILRTIQRAHEPIRTARPYTSPATAELLDHCLAKDPAQRYTDAPALLQALELCRAALSQSDTESADAVGLVASLVQQEERGQRVRSDPSGGRPASAAAPEDATAIGASAGAPTEALPAARQSQAPATPPDPLGNSPEAPWTPPSAVLQLITGGRASVPERKSRRMAEIVAIVAFLGAAVAGGLLLLSSGSPAKEPVGPVGPAVPVEKFDSRDAESAKPQRPELPAKLSRAVGTFAVEGGAVHARVTLVRDGEPPRAYDFVLDDAGRLAPAECEAGSYAVTAVREGFDPFTGRVEIDEGRPATVTATMRERDAFLSVDTRPPGAEVLVDDVAVGRTPLLAKRVRPGTRNVLLRLAEHGEVVRSVPFVAGNPVDLREIPLSPWPVLDLTEMGDGVTAEVGGAPRSGRVAVAPGSVVVKLLRPGCVAQERTLEVALGQTALVRPEAWREATTQADPVPPEKKPLDTASEPPLDDATRRRMLTDVAAWDAATSAQRRAAAEAVARRATGITLKELRTFSCGGASHEVAIFGHERTGLEFVLVPGGTTRVGSPDGETGRAGDERQQTLTLTRPFLMARTECTQAAYEKVVGVNPSHFRGASLPVEVVTWEAAKSFCDRAGLQLPTEAQWEYACRAGTTTRFCAGDSDAALDEVGWFDTNSGGATHDVGTKKPNAFGLFDVHGNVWEWCADGYGVHRPESAKDPAGPSDASNRVVRGGSWDFPARGARSAFRGGRGRDYRGPDFGFRPARLLPAE